MAVIEGKYRRYNGSGWDEIKFPPATHSHALSDLSGRTLDKLSEPSYFYNTPTVTTMSRVDKLRANRFAGGIHPTSIICEQSTDAGATWTSSGLTDNSKLLLLSSTGSALFIPLKNGVKSTDCMARITISGIEFNDTVKAASETERFALMTPENFYANRVYGTVSDFYFWLSSNSDYINITVERSRGNAKDTWEQIGQCPKAVGWSGMNTIHTVDSTFAGGSTQTGNSWFIRITFRTCASDGSYDDSKLSTYYTTSRQQIMNIMGYGCASYYATEGIGSFDRPYYFLGNNGTYGHSVYEWQGDFNPKDNKTFALGSTSKQWAVISGTTIYENGSKLSDTYVSKSTFESTVGNIEAALTAIIG